MHSSMQKATGGRREGSREVLTTCSCFLHLTPVPSWTLLVINYIGNDGGKHVGEKLAMFQILAHLSRKTNTH
jgi:hypothetical protein